MESKWRIYQELFHEITVHENMNQIYCKELGSDIHTEFGICLMVYNFSVKFITDRFDEMHCIDPDVVKAMIMALKNYIWLNKKILLEKSEADCQCWAETIMDRIIWYYSGSNYTLADIIRTYVE